MEDYPQEPDLFKASQYGDLQTIEDLISKGLAMANDRDKDNITGLHWASINNHLHIVQFLVSKGAEVDAFGGDLHSTPLHWAARQGNVNIVSYLVSVGANPNLADKQHFNALHLAAQYGHVMVCLYLLAYGMEVDSLDQNRRTPLMWSVYKAVSDEVTQVLIKFGANLHLYDTTHYTALHWAISQGNRVGCHTLLTHGSNIEAQDSKGVTCRELAVTKEHKWFEETVKSVENAKVDMKYRKVILYLVPFIAQGAVFALLTYYRWYIAYLLVVVLGYLTSLFVRKVAHGKELQDTPFLSAIFQSSVFWIMATHFTYLMFETKEYLFINCLIGFLLVVVVYSLQHVLFSDPGVVPPPATLDDAKMTILALSERYMLDRRTFCSTCLVRKPLRSKHDRTFDRCYAKYDHFCPWVYNVVGANNHLEFIMFIGASAIGQFLYAFLAFTYVAAVTDSSIPKDPYCYLPYDFCSYTQQHMWIISTAVWCIITGFWEFTLFFSQVYMTSKGLTTNEQMNSYRYGFVDKNDPKKKISSPFDKGFFRNWIEFIGGYDVNWTEAYELNLPRSKAIYD